MVILAQQWAASFMEEAPEISVQVAGGGSGTGIAALRNGTAHIATSSRAITDDERLALGDVVEAVVATDALAIYVNRQNGIASLTLAQIASMFEGEVQSWQQVGAQRRGRIVLYSRENNSGTYVYFKEHVLGRRDFAAEVQMLPGTAAVINAVAHDEASIGYGGIGFGRGVRVVPVSAEDGAPAYLPTEENAMSGAYPLARPLFLYAKRPMNVQTERFMTWVQSEQGQAQVQRAGYFAARSSDIGQSAGTP